MYIILTVLHVIISILLIITVLMQSSKGDGLSGAFGGGGGLPQQMLGSRGMTTALHKATIYLATGFFLTSALLFIVGGRRGTVTVKDVVSQARQSGELPAPVEAPLTPIGGQQAGSTAGGAGGPGQETSQQQDGGQQ